MKHLKWLAVCLGMASGPGCYTAGYYDPYYYDYVYYDPYYYAYDVGYTYTWVDPVYDDFYYYARGGGPSSPNVLDLSSIASRIATSVNNYYGSGCVTATPSGATVSFVYSGCTGPLGLAAITGNVLLTLSENAGQLAMAAKSTNLTVGGDPYNLDVSATVPSSGGALMVTSRSYSPARVDSRQAETTVTWVKGSGCFDVTGQSQSARGDLSASSSLTGYHRCSGQCPTSGTVTVNAPSGTFTGTFDGSNKLVVTAPNGEPKNYDLNCQ